MLYNDVIYEVSLVCWCHVGMFAYCIRLFCVLYWALLRIHMVLLRMTLYICSVLIGIFHEYNTYDVSFMFVGAPLWYACVLFRHTHTRTQEQTYTHKSEVHEKMKSAKEPYISAQTPPMMHTHTTVAPTNVRNTANVMYSAKEPYISEG